MNASARLSMKDAANCDKQCELQNSVNHQISERTLRYRAFLIACLVSASTKPIMPSRVQNVLFWSVRVCAPVRCPWGNHWRMKCNVQLTKLPLQHLVLYFCIVFLLWRYAIAILLGTPVLSAHYENISSVWCFFILTWVRQGYPLNLSI